LREAFAPAKKRLRLFMLAFLWAIPAQGLSFCHDIDVAQVFYRTAATKQPRISIEWFGHSTFQITSSKGARILTDPHGRQDLIGPACRNIS
jgi:hypothetical protein